MTEEEAKEQREILKALDAAEFRTEEFNQWIDRMDFQPEGPKRGWWWFVTKHGHLTFTFKTLSEVSRITFCSYVPRSTNKGIPLVTAGSSASGKSLSESDVKAIQSDFSFEAIPRRVLLTCAFEVRWAPEDVTAKTNIVEDLLDGDDDEFEKRYLLNQTFDELEIWFKFKRPDLEEQLGTFRTVQDIITYVEKHYEKG